jgi:hypothetical protein
MGWPDWRFIASEQEDDASQIELRRGHHRLKPFKPIQSRSRREVSAKDFDLDRTIAVKQSREALPLGGVPGMASSGETAPVRRGKCVRPRDESRFHVGCIGTRTADP